ncbi:MAG TPA: hypothetical protein PK715_14025, partial [Chitinophagales bacterium]|nr:hypothetical protein [Chitinophagales bacterium]
MKKCYSLLLCLGLLCAVNLSAQNISLEVDGDDLYYSESGCGDCTGLFGDAPDPRWRARLFVGSSNYDWNVDRSNVSCGWQNITNFSWYNPTTVGYSTNVSMQLNGFEFDDEFSCLFNANDASCGGYGTVNSAVAATNSPPCQWNYFTGTRNCTSDGVTGTWGIYWSIYWRYQFSPTLSTETPLNQVRCNGAAPATLSVTSNADANSRVLTRFYKWQISNTPTGPWSDIGTPSANSAATITFTPGQISGTRYYRMLATSNCSADFGSNTAISNVFTVTYAFIASGPYTNQPGWTYGAGDGAPQPVSGVCGGTVLPGQLVPFSALQSPNAGAAVNVTSFTWAASGGSPTSGTGTTFNWTAPTTAGAYSVSITYNYSGCSSPATAVCAVNVGAPNCDFAYVAPGGSNVTTAGGPNNPYATISYALSQLGSRNYIRVASGTITETAPVSIPANVIIEGGYQVSSGNWIKSSGATTTVSCSGTETINADIAHTIGFKSSGSNGWTLQDLTINTANASGTASSGMGRSNYALWILNSTGYTINRCNITAGSASNGANGSGYVNNGGGGGTGGNGGSGANGNGNPGGGANGTAGSNGGSGYSGAPTNQDGTGGTGGTGTDNCGGGSGGCPIGNSGGCNGSAGSNGSNGESGAAWPANNRPTVAIPNDSYFLPGGQAENGGG